MAHNMLHVMRARCVARALHTIAPWPVSVRVGDGSRRSEETAKKKKKISNSAFEYDHDHYYHIPLPFSCVSIVSWAAFEALLFFFFLFFFFFFFFSFAILIVSKAISF